MWGRTENVKVKEILKLFQMKTSPAPKLQGKTKAKQNQIDFYRSIFKPQRNLK